MPRDTWIPAKPTRWLFLWAQKENMHNLPAPLHFPLSLLIVQYWNTYLNSISAALLVLRLRRLLRCYSSSFVACCNWCIASADYSSLLLGVELHDLVVAQNASQRCLSNVAFDCTSKMAHFASEWVACSSSLRRGKKRKWTSQREGGLRWGGSWLHSLQSHVSSFLALLSLTGSLWMVPS